MRLSLESYLGVVPGSKMADATEMRAHFRRLDRDRTLWHVVADLDRPGAVIFLMRLEYTYFPPHSAKNDQFQMCIVEWFDRRWALVTIPAKTSRFAHRTAERTGMRIADGIPTILEAGGGGVVRTYRFPFRSPRLFTLENARNSPIYSGPAGEAQVEAEQEEAIARLHQSVLRQHGRN